MKSEQKPQNLTQDSPSQEPEVRITHLADLHLRVRQYGHSFRGNDFYQAAKKAILAAFDMKADAIICAGDLLDSQLPSAYTVTVQLQKLDELLREKKLIMYITSGNHDRTTPHWASAFNGTPEEGGMLVVDNEMFDIKGITVYGAPYMPNAKFRELLQDESKKADILMWHGAIKEFCGYPVEGAVELEEFPAHWQLVAMGDQHIKKGLINQAGVLVYYPGTLEMCSIAEDENKYVSTHVFKNGKHDCILEKKIETRPVQRFTITTTEELDKALEEMLPNSIVRYHYDKNVPGVVAKIKAKATGTNVLLSKVYDAVKEAQRAANIDTKIAADSPTEYVNKNIAAVVEEEVGNRIKDLSAYLVDPNGEEFKGKIDEYVKCNMEA